MVKKKSKYNFLSVKIRVQSNLVNTDTGGTLESVHINSVSVFSLFQALRKWGRSERERHAKSWLGGKKEEVSSFFFFFQFPPVLFSCLRFLQFSEPDCLGACNRLRVRIRWVQEPIGSWRVELKMYGTKQTDRNNYDVSVS